ncbi:MAG TPA: hypothetical protein PKE64_20120 [Anaerolineae bacterium]|nr:hypothetical protein [Anaerolineae bacterium]HMR66325.1 hypothetical protein [Anaerolineae bacterium]
MQLNKVAPVEGKDSPVLGNDEGLLIGVRQANLSGLKRRENIYMPSAQLVWLVL